MKTGWFKTSSVSVQTVCLGALALACGITGCSTGNRYAEYPRVNNAEFTDLAAPTGREGWPAIATTQASGDAAIGQGIYSLLMARESLAPGPNPVIATVRDGTVTLSGQVPKARDKQELRAAISALPGVQRVDDSGLITGLGRVPGSHEAAIGTGAAEAP